MKRLIIVLIMVSMLVGCDKQENQESSHSEEKISLGDEYILNQSVGGIAFYTLKEDVEGLSMVIPEDYSPVTHLVSDHECNDKGIYIFSNQYYCFGDGYMYAAIKDISFCDSLQYAETEPNSVIESMHTDYLSNFSAEGKPVLSETDEGLNLETDIYYESEGNQYLGHILVEETKEGQSIYLVGSFNEHFSDAVIDNLFSSVSFHTDATAIIDQTQDISISNFGKALNLTLYYPFIDNNAGYSDIGAGREWYSWNPYYQYSLMFRSFRSYDNLNVSDVAMMFSEHGVEEEGNIGSFTKFKATGFTDFSDEYDESYLYVSIQDNYSYVFILSCDNDMAGYDLKFEQSLIDASFSDGIDEEQPENINLYEINYRIRVNGEELDSVYIEFTDEQYDSDTEENESNEDESLKN